MRTRRAPSGGTGVGQAQGVPGMRPGGRLRAGWLLPATLVALAAACGGEDRGDGAEPSGREARAAAGVTSEPLEHGDILPGLGVTGPTDLPPVEPAGDGAEAAFVDALFAHCTPAPPPTEGFDEPAVRAAFPGRTTLNTLSNPEPFEGAVLRMVLDDCDGDRVPIPFLVDEDRSRTWVLEFVETGFRLAHDHRHPDGTPGEANLYGGVAHVAAGEPGGARPGGAVTRSGPGAGETILYFPADPPTIDDRPARAANTWAMAVDRAGEHFFYRLYLDGVLRLEAAFDLSRTVPVLPQG
jgi:hypothetical protein